MRRLVGIDAGMLNQHFTAGDIFGRGLIRRERCGELGAVHANVDVTAAGYFEFLKAGDDAHTGDDLFGNFARGFSKLPGKLKSNGERVLSKVDLRRLFDDDVGDFQAVSTTQKLPQRFDQPAFEMTIQVCSLTS